MKVYKYKGKDYNQEQLCKENNISVGTFRSRLKISLSVEESLQHEFKCKCVICDKEFISDRPNKKYCCITCRNRGKSGKGKYKSYVRTCIVCGNTFQTNKGYHTKTCSKHCRNQLARIDRNRRYKDLKIVGDFDESVTLENVFNKFNGVCVCCNKKTIV